MVGTVLENSARFSCAPMMDWTDRHCRYLHRLMSRRALLYTEMITSPALVRGFAVHLLAFDPAEHPVAVQLGGSDPKELAAATRICAAQGYDEVNLNIGCPSDRVQSGCFGAVLMEQPDLVADCAGEMIGASSVEITVKCRIGVDDQVSEQVLPDFLEKVSAAGVNRFAIHARKAWLKGLSPKENRDIPPLNYPLVYAMKKQFPHLHLSINGGIETLDQAQAHLRAGMDGVMVGRAAYHNPAAIMLNTDEVMFGDPPGKSVVDVVHEMIPYIDRHVADGGRVNSVTRHMLGLFTGAAGARHWRRVLSENAHRTDATSAVVLQALAAVLDIQALQAAE